MDPYRYLQQVSELFDTLDDKQQINTVLDELEYIYELLDPELQSLASDMIERLTRKLQTLED